MSGAKQTISSTISATMTDNGDGTYSYSFSLQLDGAVTIIVKLLSEGGVSWAWYPNTSMSGTPILYNTTSDINVYMNGGVFLPGGYTNYISGKLTSEYQQFCFKLFIIPHNIYFH